MGVVCTAEREVGGSGKEHNYSKDAVESAATQGAYYNVISPAYAYISLYTYNTYYNTPQYNTISARYLELIPLMVRRTKHRAQAPAPADSLLLFGASRRPAVPPLGR